jgi:hypothetical protein
LAKEFLAQGGMVKIRIKNYRSDHYEFYGFLMKISEFLDKRSYEK